MKQKTTNTPSSLIYLVQSDAAQAEQLSQALIDNDYRVEIVTETSDFLHTEDFSPDADAPAAVVMDMVFLGDALAPVVINNMGSCRNSKIPIIATSKLNGMPARLATFRAGAKHFLNTPVDTVRLIRLLDEMTGRLQSDPYRILLVEDEKIATEIYQTTLTKAGMEVRSLSNPLKALDEINNFNPDVVILDINMPEINGQELVAILRESGFQLPVLFLSGESDRDQQLSALKMGGDDFLIKPVPAEQLVATVTARAKRSRRGNAVCRRLEKTLYERDRDQFAVNQHAIVSAADDKGIITEVNERFCEVSGYSANELLGQNHSILKSGIHPDQFYQDMWNTLTRGEVWHGEICNLTKDRNRYWVDAAITPFLDDQGKPYRYVSIRTDITQNKAREQSLRAIVDGTAPVSGEAFLHNTVQGLAESMGVRFSFIAEIDKDDESIAKTSAFWDTDRIIENFSYPVKGTPCEKVGQTGLAAYLEKVADLFPEDVWLKENGIESYIGIPLFDSNKNYLGHLGILDDKPLADPDEKVDLLRIFAASVTSELEREQSEAALKASESRLNFLVTSSPVTIFTCEVTPPFAANYVSPNVKQLMGYEAEQFTEESNFWAKNIHPEDSKKVFDELPQLFENGVHQHEYRFLNKDGNYVWVYDELRLIKNTAGEPIEIAGYWADITERKLMEQSLEHNKERLRRGQIFANIGTWDWNIITGELFWSERIGPLFGYDEGELETSYENFINSVHPDDRQLVSDAVNACVEHGTPYDIEHRVIWPDGTVRWLQERGATVRDADDKPLQMLGVVQDIDIRKQAELALVEREHQLSEAQTLASLGNWSADLLTGELHWSDEIFRIFGYKPGSIVPSVEVFHAAVHPDDLAKVNESQKAAEQTGYLDVIHRAVRPDGDIRHVHELAMATTDTAGQLIHLTGTVQDITERVEAEAILAENEEKFRGLYEKSPIGIALNEMDGDFVEANQSFLDIVGYSEEECRELTYWQLTPEEYATQEAEQLESLNSSGYYGPYEKEYIHKDGHRVAVLLNGSIVHNHEGRKRIWSVVQNISQRKQAELAMQESEERFAFAVEGAGDGIWDWDMRSNAMQFSRLYMEMLGYAENELPHHIDTWIESVHPGDMARVQKNLQEYLEGLSTSYHVELRLRCKNNDYKWVLCRGQVVDRDDDDNAIRMIGIHSDITEHKHAENIIKNSQQRMALHVQRTPLAVIEWDIHFNITDWNTAAESIFKFTREEALGRHATELIIPETAIEGVAEAWEQLLTLKGGLRSTNENVTKDGKVILCDWYNTPLVDDDGKVMGVASLIQDITKQKEAEQALFLAKTEAEDANNAKSEFLSSMSHELRTPMNGILGFGQLLKYDEKLTDEQQDNVHEILKAGHHLLELINEVLDLAKVESGQIDLSLEPVDVQHVVDECLSLVQALADKKDIQISHSDLAGVAVRADYTRLKQALINLLSNAIKYNREGGEVKIEVQQIDDRLQIIIKDTGLGIPADRLAELFQPFNRLDAEMSDVEGTGIGLTITRRIVEMMGGSVDVHSEMGVGSRFWIELPAESLADSIYDNTTDDVNPNMEQSHLSAQHTVLYIEDNPANLKLVSHILGHRKYIHLLTAHTPEIGIELALKRKPELILLDINMPNMDGYQVLEIFKADAGIKHVPVVAVTANAMQRDIKRGKKAGFADYVTKPIDVSKFLNTVDSFLSEQ